MQKKKIVVLLVILTLALSLFGCSKDELKNDVDKVKSEVEALTKDAESFFASKKEALGEFEEKVVADLKHGETIVVDDVKNAGDFAKHLEENVVTKIQDLEAKAKDFNTDHPLLKDAKEEYHVILSDLKTKAENVIAAIKNGEQEAFDVAKKDFEIAKEKFINFEEAIKSKLTKK